MRSLLIFSLTVYAFFSYSAEDTEGISYEGMQRNLTKIRAKALPSSPNNADEITKIFESEFVRKHYGETLRKNEEEKTMFFKHATQSEDYAMCIFASQDIINAINVNIEVQDRQLFMDGTFKVREIFSPTL